MDARIPPHNTEAEKSVLGAMMLERDAVVQVSETLSAEDFYREPHKIIYETMIELYNNNKAIDMITVIDLLKSNNKLDSVGGMKYVMSIANSVPTAANVAYHATIVSDKSILRKVATAATEVVSMVYDGEYTPVELVDVAEKKILEISNQKKHGDFTKFKDILMSSVEKLEALAGHEGGITGISTGFIDLDSITSGLHPSDFIILAARPSMGKTAFALNLTGNVAFRSKKEDGSNCSVAFFSLEMSKEQLVNRIISSEAGIDAQALTSGKLNDEDWESLWSTCGKVDNADIYIDDTPGITVMEMRSRARRLKAKKGLDLIVIDYLQLMQGQRKSSSGDRQQEVSEISRSLKALARELDVPVIALSQLSRSVEARQSKRPMLSDLRESGSLEQDADIVAFLYRDDYYNPDTEIPNLTELIIAKHRNGPVDTINLFFQKNLTKFRSLSKRIE